MVVATDTETRRVVTLVFADLIGSTTLHERIDAESARRVMADYYAALSAVVEDHDGTVIKLLGDGVLAGFGLQRAQENDAARAVRAAVAMHGAMAHLRTDQMGQLGLRVGVNTGEVVVSDGDDDVVGDPVNVAARLQQEAQDGEVLIGDSTRRLVDDLVTLEAAGEFSLKGRIGAVAAHRVVSLESPTSAAATPFVGRDEELRRILAAQSSTAVGRVAKLAVVVGSPGLGKSRLMDEVARRLDGEVTILTARCEADGGPTFTPVADALRALVSTDVEPQGADDVRSRFQDLVPEDEPERNRIVDGAVALCAGEPGPPEETFWVVRRVLGAMGRDRPVVLALDDLHWAEPLLLDLIEHLVEWTTDVPLFVLGAARPELRATRSSLTTQGEMADEVVALDGLDAGAATRLAADAIGAAELPAAVAGRVLAASEGNPLFLRALVRMLVDDGALQWDGDRWIAKVGLDDIDMPPTIHALLAARIDRLEPPMRLVLERASVIGRQFTRGAVMHLVPVELRAELDTTLDALRRSELIEPDAGWLLGEPSIRFHHALIRDAAYRRLLKDACVDLHGAFAQWLEDRLGDATDHDETIGWHLEQAYLHLHELGPLDDRARSLGSRAAERLGAEGRRALARDDLTVAANLIGRAVGVLDAQDPKRSELLLDWCESLLASGDVGAARSAIDDLDRSANDGRLRAWHTSFVGHLVVLTDPQRLRETAEAVTDAADTLATLGDAAGEAKAHSVRALALARLGEVGACEIALDKALVAARRAKDRRRSNAVLAGAPVAALWGPSPVTRASGRCLDVVRVLRITAAAPAVEAVAMRCQAVLEALRGRSEAARRMIATSRRTVEDLGLTTRILEADMAAGLIELISGDADAAEVVLRPTYHGFRDRGLGVDAAQAGALLLGRALLALNRISEAEAISHECEATAGDDLKAAIAWRGVRAEALARRGRYSSAIEFAREAVALAADTDALLDHADARVALAVALRVAGQHTEADAEMAAAFELWSAKGASALLGAPEPATAELTGGLQQATSPVRPNRATANADRMDAAIRARDIDAFADGLAQDFQSRYHPLELFGGRDEIIESFRTAFVAGDVVQQRTDVATLGDALALCHQQVALDPNDEGINPFGTALMEHLLLIEVGPDGRRRLGEVFQADDLERAMARLHELNADTAPEGNLALTALRTSERRWRDGNWDGVLAVYDPEVYVLDDRRSLMHVRSSGERFVENLRFLFDDGAFTSTFEAGRGDRLALVRAAFVSNRKGAFSTEHCAVAETDADGRLIRMVLFDIDHIDDAYAELEARHRASKPTWTPNLATASVQRLAEALDRMDWDAIEAELAPEFVDQDRRAHMQHDQDRAQYLAMYRMAEDNLTRWTTSNEILVTRGDRLAVVHRTFRSHGPEIGENESEYLVVIEVNADGQRVAGVTFDVDERDAADAELDARHGEQQRPFVVGVNTATGVLERFRHAMNTKDVELAEGMIANGFRTISRRRMFQGESNRDEHVAFLRLAAGLDEAVVTAEVLATRGDRLAVSRLSFRSEDRLFGTSEVDYVEVLEVDEEARLAFEVTFDPDDLHGAYAELDRLYTAALEPVGASPGMLSNAASRASDGTFAYFAAQDWSAHAASTHPDFVYRDHRNGMHTEFETQQWIESMQLMAASNARPERRQLAVLGDRAMLEWVRWTGTSEDPAAVGARFEVELLRVVAVDDAGLLTSVDSYDVDDRQAANDELWRLDEQAGEGLWISALINENRRAFNRRDLQAMRATLRDDFVFDDRRRTGSGTLGADAYVESLMAIFAETEDLVSETLYRAATSEWGTLSVARMMGRARDGGDFETELLRLFITDGHLLTRVEIFETDDLEFAIERFNELAGTRPLDIPPNGATRWLDRFAAIRATGDWDLVAQTARPDMVFDDRRMVHLALTRDEWIESCKLIAGTDPVELRTPLSVLGERLALVHAHWDGRADGGIFDVDMLYVIEVDAGETLVKSVVFDASDRRAANEELWRLYEQSDEGQQLPAVIFRNVEAFNLPDLTALRATYRDDFVFDDHRRTGSGRLDADTHVASVGALLDETEELVSGTLYRVAANRLGTLSVGYTVGRSGQGGEFENVFVRLMMTDGALITRVEIFETEQLDDATARFDELTRPAPTACTRALQRFDAAYAEQDFSAFESQLHPSMTFEDRRALTGQMFGANVFVEMLRHASVAGAHLDRKSISTLGDRLALDHLHWKGPAQNADEGPGDFELDFLGVQEVDADGLLIAIVCFDPHDRRAADQELLARSDVDSSVDARIDVEEFRALLADDCVLVDHRPFAAEPMDRDAYVDYYAVLLDETSDVQYTQLEVLEETADGRVELGSVSGHSRAGSEFADSFLRVTMLRDGLFVRMEIYGPDDVDVAVARFKELTGDGV